MKIKNIQLNNFAKYDNVNVNFDDNVTYLVGKNGSGKSTLGITGIHFMFQGIAEKASNGTSPLIGERFRFIGPKSPTSKGEMILFDEKKNIEVKVFRKLTKSGSELSFEGPEGMELNQQWLTDLFNIFLIAPKKFTELTPKDQAKALGIDTKKIDTELESIKQEATIIGRTIKSFGTLTPVEETRAVDFAQLSADKDAIVKFNKEQKERQEAIEKFSKHVSDLEAESEAIAKQIDELKAKQIILATRIKSGTDYVSKLEKPEQDKPLDSIEQEIKSANDTNKKAVEYDIYVKNKKNLEAEQKKLSDNKSDQKKKEDERVNYIKSFKLPFSNLSIGEDGELLLDNKPIKEPYFSTGELIKLIPILIGSRNPELKYVFLQDFNLLDEEKQAEVETYLTGKGFQLVVEYIGKSKLADKNCILLKDNVVVEDYSTSTEPSLT